MTCRGLIGTLTGVLSITSILMLACRGSSETTFISIGTGGTGGVYYPYGGGLAEIWSKNLPGIKAVAEVTAASVENVKLAHKGETVIGEVMGDVAYQAYHGEGQFEGNRQNILAMAVMYPNIMQVVALKSSGVESMSQLEGETVSIGAPGSGTAYMSDLVFDVLGIAEESFRTRRLSFIESANAMRDHTISVGIWSVAPPTSSIMDLATTHDINLIPFSPTEQKKITERYPFYTSYNLPAGIYRGIEAPVPTISVWNVIICKADLPEELVYNLTRVLFENNDYLQQIHHFAVYTTVENTLNHTPIPLHPGSINYIKDIGFEVPAELVPDG